MSAKSIRLWGGLAFVASWLVVGLNAHAAITGTDQSGTALHREYSAMSGVRFVVPAEERFRSRYLQMAKSTEASERMEAAANLWKFPGAESETALRLLLDDKTESISASVADSIAAIEYAIRSCAYRGLKHLGKVVPEHIVLKRLPTAEEQKSYRLDYWKSRFKRVERAVESIEILETRTLKGEGESVSILARLDVGASHLSVIIVPYSWQVKKLPEAELMGYDSDFRQRDTCVYFVKGTSAKEHIDLVRRLFGIRPPAR